MTGALVSDRADRLLAGLAEDELDALLVTDLTDVRYLTGFSGTNGIALVGPDRRQFVTDFRYGEQAAGQVGPGFQRVVAPRDLLFAVTTLLEAGHRWRVGFDDTHLTVRQHRRLVELLGDRAELVPAAGRVKRLRRSKEPGELERIAAAARLADEALAEVLSGGLAGRTEQAVALALETAMRSRGAERASFPPIVAAGPHGALPHAEPRDVVIGRDQVVVIDWGARLEGYCSDCTRTVFTGEPQGEAREVYGLLLHAQRSGVAALHAGAEAAAVDEEVREQFSATGYGDHFGHGLGHGVGLAVHEAPTLNGSSDEILAAGDVVTVEPGIYLPGRFGMRIEDLAAVTDDGCEVLTGLSRELTVVD